MVSIRKISGLDISVLDRMADKALSEGYFFVQRTINEWNSGDQRFAGKGEGFWGMFLQDELIGIGGLSCDPYVNDKQIGRVRHLYIMPEFRNKGYGKQMMHYILAQASGYFKSLTLFTENPLAAKLYEHTGFHAVNDYKVTHRLDLQVR